jgi:hypothetical protein
MVWMKNMTAWDMDTPGMAWMGKGNLDGLEYVKEGFEPTALEDVMSP